MAHELTFYFKKQFPHLKEKYVQMGYRINSISKYKNSNDAEETEEKCLVDISSLHGILSQQGMQYNFENLFESFPENSIFKNNERLEFLGDSILGYIISEYLYINYPDEPEGKLSKMKAVIVSEPSLAEGARKLNLEEYLILKIIMNKNQV